MPVLKASGQRAAASCTASLASIDMPSISGAAGLEGSVDIFTAYRDDSPMLIPLRLAAQKAGANSDGITCIPAAGMENPAVSAMPRKQEEIFFISGHLPIECPTGDKSFRLAAYRNQST